jgi:hypothetical protein
LGIIKQMKLKNTEAQDCIKAIKVLQHEIDILLKSQNKYQIVLNEIQKNCNHELPKKPDYSKTKVTCAKCGRSWRLHV